MKCPNEDCESNESEHYTHGDMHVADASVQWTANETLDHAFNLDDFTVEPIRGGETSECTAIVGIPRPYVREISCAYCGEELDGDDIMEKIGNITPEQIRKTFVKMPFPEWRISGRKKK